MNEMTIKEIKEQFIKNINDIHTLNLSIYVLEQLQAYKDKEDKLREYIEHNDFSDWHIGKDKDQFRKNDLLQILNEGSDK